MNKLCVSFVIACVFLAFGSAKSVAQPHRVVGLTGSPADDGLGGASTYGAFGVATLNDSGQVAFLAELVPGGAGQTAGIWSEGDGLGAKLVAADGRVAGGIAGAIYENLIATRPSINNLGQTHFRGRLETGPGGVTINDNSGIWIANPGEGPQLVLREGNPLPGITPVHFGAQDGFDRQFATFNNIGQTVVQHLLPLQPTVTGNSDSGVWRSGLDQPTATIAREGSQAAGFTPGTTYYGHISGTPTINDAGQIAFFAPILPFPGQPSTGEAIWMGTPGNVDLVLKSGDIAPGIVEGSTFVDLETPSINNAGGYAFSGIVDDSPAGIETYNNSGIWASRIGGPLELLYREGDNPPDTPSGAGFGFISTVLMNSSGEIAFRGAMQGVPGMGFSGVSSSNDQAIWSEGGGGGLREVAREDDQPVGTEVGVGYDFFAEPVINALGQTAFTARLSGTGIDASNRDGIFAEDTNGVLHLIARTGDMLDVDSGPGLDERTITSLFFWGGTGNEDGRRSGFNEKGQLAFTATFSDGTAGIFVSDLVASLGLNGDYNGNGIVDAADYTVWLDALGSTSELAADGDNSGTVDAADYGVWKSNFGATTALTAEQASSGTLAVTGVPEPGTLTLALFAVAGMLARRRLAIYSL